MKLIYNKIFLNHDTDSLLENKERFKFFGKIKETNIENGERYLKLVHSEKYVESVKKMSNTEMIDFSNDIILSKKSYEVACYAVGATILASQNNDFALVRPPGHHAGFKIPNGFCIFNNIAIAVKKLILEGKKIAILDFDGHYGNGTAKIFYDSQDVLYISVHQYPAYPGKGFINEIGSKNGLGYTINLPLPPYSGDDLLIKSIKFSLPIIKQFNPDILAVSAGFDGHHSDSILNLNFSINGYYEVGKILTKNFPRIFTTLEGGYNNLFLPKCVYNFIAGINRKVIRYSEGYTKSDIFVKDEYEKRIKKLSKNLNKYWKLN